MIKLETWQFILVLLPLAISNFCMIIVVFKMARKRNDSAFDYVKLLLKYNTLRKKKKTEGVNPENKCAHLFVDLTPKKDGLMEIFQAQKKFERSVVKDFDKLNYQQKIEWISKHFRNLCIEFGELMNRLPYKEWKNYKLSEREGIMNREDRLEIEYEYTDMACFFFNIGIYLGIDWRKFYSLYMTKNKENFNRQKRGY